MPLKMKNVFLTGGAQGIGKAYTEALLKNGARVVFGDIDEALGKKTENEFGETYGRENVLFVYLDVTVESQLKDAFAKAVNHLGFVDLMINNAGILDDNKLELTVAINFTAMAKGTLIAEKHMRKDWGGRGGRVINCSSISGTRLDTAYGHPSYNATKHAIRVFTHGMAAAPDIKEQGMQYATLCPCAVKTRMLENLESRCRFGDLFRVTTADNMSNIGQVVEGVLLLASLEDMNGAVLEALSDKLVFVSVDRREIGDKWPVSETGSNAE